MPNSPAALSISESPNKQPNAKPLTRTVKSPPLAQVRKEQKLLEKRQSWSSDEILAGVVVQEEIIEAEATDWVKLLQAAGSFTAPSRVSLNALLAPYHLTVPGPMNTRTLQYIVNVHLHQSAVDQVEAAERGLRELLPYIKPVAGAKDFGIRPLGTRLGERNWLRVLKDGTTQVIGKRHPAVAFNDLRSALLFICEHRAAA